MNIKNQIQKILIELEVMFLPRRAKRIIRKRKRTLLNKEYPSDICLVMTLVVQNEESIIEQHIRFHKAMGVDAFIVTNHNSTDNTGSIIEKLKSEGYEIEVINKTGAKHEHSLWVNEMVNIAKTKYKADWVINSDADEFYYSKNLNLKKEMINIHPVNVLRVYSTYFVPEAGNENFLEGTLFIKNPLNEFEYELNNLEYNEFTATYEAFPCPKCIHRTKGFKRGSDGNHYVKMKNYKEISPYGITLYHYHIRNLEHLKQKALKAIPSINSCKDPNWNGGWRNLAKHLQNNTLEDYFNKRFSGEILQKMLELGVVTRDKSVYNFLKYKNII